MSDKITAVRNPPENFPKATLTKWTGPGPLDMVQDDLVKYSSAHVNIKVSEGIAKPRLVSDSSKNKQDLSEAAQSVSKGCELTNARIEGLGTYVSEKEAQSVSKGCELTRDPSKNKDLKEAAK